jgi:hypothetical protein
LLSSAKYEQRVDKFLTKYNYENISLSDFTNQINSDYAEKNYTTRTDSLSNIIKVLAKISDNRNVMASTPNKYAFSNADIMTETPLSSSGANIFDMDVPFLQMVLAGYVDMTTSAINISDGEFDLLKLMAYNTLPNFNLIYEESSILKDTSFSDLYSMNYEDWSDEAVELYKSYSADMMQVRGKTITKWQANTDGIVIVTYEGGYSFLINRTNKAVNVNGEEIAAKTYKFYKEGLNYELETETQAEIGAET